MTDAEKGRAKRRYVTQVKCTRQAKIHQKMGGNYLGNTEGSSHRFAKQKSMNCGKPNCFMCGNPRRFLGNSKEALTFQEKVARQREKSSFFLNDDQYISEE